MVDWQQRYLEADTPWDKGVATPVLVDLLESRSELFVAGMKVFVPGCGRGYDAKALAARGMLVVAADVAPVAISEARQENPHGVDFRELDIFHLDSSLIGQFDAVWEHTCFCAISPELRMAYVESMWSVLKTGGLFAGVFFTRPDVPEGSGPPFQSTREQVLECFSGRFSLEWEAEPAVCYPGREGRELLMLFRRLS